ncbi:uncharacterized protein VNE69_05168 [Vairimorpha necatrix]|uniref:Uncharacterized protein n=1 Tax=Vairimorpha necatrix TaxID=6039 RepID=A0AAX4JCB0_9MICR
MIFMILLCICLTILCGVDTSEGASNYLAVKIEVKSKSRINRETQQKSTVNIGTQIISGLKYIGTNFLLLFNSTILSFIVGMVESNVFFNEIFDV